jgi:NADH dehydrogenase (ubiquinone) Fe-S protein 6
MSQPPEVIHTVSPRVKCDGATDIAPALGHPRVWLQIDPEQGWAECGYCDRRFVLKGGTADKAAA